MTNALPALASMTDAPPPISREDLAARAQQARHDARGTRARNTDKTYEVGRQAFERWCQERGEPAPFPVPPRLLADFVDDLGQSRKPATVQTYIAAINAAHQLLDLQPPGSAMVVRLAMKRLRRAFAENGGEQKQAEPMRQAHIAEATARMGDSPADLRDAALLSLAFDGMFRASELVALNVRDVRPQGQDATARLGQSKTDQEGRGSVRFVARDTYARVRAWVEAEGLKPEDPLFPPLSNAAKGARLTPRDVARIFKRRVGEPFSAHSTRVGAAIDQRAAGVPTGMIAQAGGWKGDAMPARYTRHLDAQESGAAILARRQGRA